MGKRSLVVALIAAGLTSCAPSDPCADTPQNRDRALFATEAAVKGRLKSPASAKFPTNSEGQGAQVVSVSSCRFLVISHVDSQNSFGAMLRSSYSAYLTAKPDGSFTVDNLTLVAD